MNVFKKILERMNETKELYARLQIGTNRNSEIITYIGKEQAIDNAISIVKEAEYEYNNGWIPVEERLPDTNDYILLAFSNFTIPVVGRYEIDEDGSGAFYIGDELETCLSQDLLVNAWMELPEPYKESEKE